MTGEVISQLNENDREQVIHLLAISFPVEYSVGLEMMRFYIDRCPAKHYLLIRNSEGSIIGVTCLLDREMNYDGLKLAVTGCSYMAVHPDHRNFSVSAELSKLMFRFQEEHSDVSLGFARRVMDNYWYPFGFTGITNFGNVVVDTHKLPAGNKLSFDELEKKDIPAIMDLHTETYVKQLNSLSRSQDIWNYIIDKLTREQKKIQTIKTQEREIVGYLLRNGNTIEELCITNEHIRNAAGLIRSVFEEEDPSVKEVNFKIGITHPFSRYIRNRSAHSVNTRFAWNGGHIFRINNIPAFFKKITPVLQERLIIAGAGAFNYTIMDAVFSFENGWLHIQVPQLDLNEENRRRHFWQKLVMGVQDIEDIVDHKSNDKRLFAAMRIMFPLKNLQVPLLDEF